MTIPRFYINRNISDNIFLGGEEGKQLTKVLRCRKGDIFNIFNDSGTEFSVKIEEIKKDGVSGVVIDRFTPSTETPLHTILCQAIPKGQKMDLVVQKATEIGVKEIRPIITERSMSSLSDNKTERYWKIAKEATEQSGRSKIPVIKEPIDFDDLIESVKPEDMGLLFYPSDERTLKQILRNNMPKGKIYIFIGPEGGFTEKEANIAKSKGIYTVSLGERILRTETCGLAALSIVLYELENRDG